MVDTAARVATARAELVVRVADAREPEEGDPRVRGDVRGVVEEDRPQVVRAEVHGAVLLVRRLVEGAAAPGRDERRHRVPLPVRRAGPVRHQAVLVVAAKGAPLGRRQQDPAAEDEGAEEDDLGPPGAQEQRHARVEVGDVGPVERQVQEAHAAQPRPHEVGDGVPRRHPAQERHRAEHREGVLGEELPEGDAEERPPEDAHLAARRRRRRAVVAVLGLEERRLAQRLEPRVRGLVEQELARDGGEGVARGVDAPHEQDRGGRVQPLAEVQLADGDGGGGAVAGRARRGRDGDEDVLLDGPGAGVQAKGPRATTAAVLRERKRKRDADTAPWQHAREPQPRVVGRDLHEEDGVGRVGRPEAVHLREERPWDDEEHRQHEVPERQRRQRRVVVQADDPANLRRDVLDLRVVLCL